MSDIDQCFKRIATDINRSSDRYTKCCAAILYLTTLLKLHGEDKVEILHDVEQILDGFKPSPRCKLPASPNQ